MHVRFSDIALLLASPPALLSLVTAMIALVLAWYGWQRRQLPAAVPFSVLMLAVLFWAACHTLRAASTTPVDVLFWTQVQHGGIVLIGPMWLLFVVAYRSDAHRVPTAAWAALLIPAAVSYAAVLTNSWHELWWTQVRLDPTRPFGSLDNARGPLFWLHYGFSVGCVLLGALLYARLLWDPRPAQRRQAQLLAVAALLPLVGVLAHGLHLAALDTQTPVLLAASGLLTVYGALEHRFLDPTPTNRTWSTIARLAPAVKAASNAEEIVRAVSAELRQSGQATKVILCLPETAGVAPHLVTEALSRESSAPKPPMTERDRAFLTDVARWRQSQWVDMHDARLAGSAIQAILTRDGCQAVAAIPLVDGDQSLGVLLLGQVEQRSATSEALQVAELLGCVVATTLLNRRMIASSKNAGASPSAALALVSHELRTPLTAVVGYVDMLSKGMLGPLSEQAQEALEQIRSSGQRMLHLINDMLDMAKIEAGRYTVEPSVLDIKTIINEVVALLQLQIEARGLLLQIDVPTNVPLVHADRVRLAQVLTNLLANAIKFTEQGSITIRLASDETHVHFSVIDTGIGIAPEHLQRIFQPFEQVGDSARRPAGTGLGLAISRRLMEAMGGTLTVESNAAGGATFTGRVPLHQRDEG
jgi:signal transduction histidine kinase/uncharacterized membrane protein